MWGLATGALGIGVWAYASCGSFYLEVQKQSANAYELCSTAYFQADYTLHPSEGLVFICIDGDGEVLFTTDSRQEGR